MHKVFEKNFYQYVTFYLVRIWTYKNADEKAHTFSRRSKNVKKADKNGRKTLTAYVASASCRRCSMITDHAVDEQPDALFGFLYEPETTTAQSAINIVESYLELRA